MARDLDRWSGNASAPEELGELLRSARADVPSAAELSGLAGKLGPLLDAPAPPAALPPPATTGSGMPGLAKLAVLVAVGGLVGGGVYFGTRSPSEPQPAPAHTHGTPAADAQRAPKVEAPRPATPAVEPTPSLSADAAAEVARDAPQTRAPVAAKPSEAALLNQAQQALKTDPRRALELTRRHKQLYPQGSLSQEREVIAIEALSRLDKKNSAHERAEAFSEKYPESAHQKKVDTTLKEPTKP
ncbi:MAG TPA: hypothetical protein VFU02_19195 [Polyangiaceae bacterium]|nr:hypothetical protein [Polyangiaceae bacterium]